MYSSTWGWNLKERKMKNIKRTSDIVKEILEHVPKTRNSDDELYFEVCKRINPEAMSKPFYMVVLQRKAHQLPPFESVRRTRQKLQASYPELCGSDEVEAWRVVNEEAVRNYARSVGV